MIYYFLRLKDYFRIIFFFTLVGISAAYLYHLSHPKKYTAVMKIKLAEISVISSANLMGKNYIQDPYYPINGSDTALLIESYFNQKKISSCHQSDGGASIYPSAISYKEDNRYIDLSITSTNASLAEKCALDTYKIISDFNDEAVKVFIDKLGRVQLSTKKILQKYALSSNDSVASAMSLDLVIASMISSSELAKAQKVSDVVIVEAPYIGLIGLMVIGSALGCMLGCLAVWFLLKYYYDARHSVQEV